MSEKECIGYAKKTYGSAGRLKGLRFQAIMPLTSLSDFEREFSGVRISDTFGPSDSEIRTLAIAAGGLGGYEERRSKIFDLGFL